MEALNEAEAARVEKANDAWIAELRQEAVDRGSPVPEPELEHLRGLLSEGRRETADLCRRALLSARPLATQATTSVRLGPAESDSVSANEELIRTLRQVGVEAQMSEDGGVLLPGGKRIA